jgi:hypothetical protein
MADWFTALANQALKLADDFTDSLVAQANEAQQQIQIEQAKLKEEELSKRQQLSTVIQLPWETEDESLQILSEALMDSILKLSLNERNFTVVPANSDEVHFVFSDFIATAMRLLQLDANLAHVHSKVSPKMDEELFWRNYYCRVIFLRAVCGIDGPSAREHAAKWQEGHQIVFEADYTPQVTVAAPAMERGQSSGAAAGKGSSSRQGATPPKPSSAFALSGAAQTDEDRELLAELGLDDDAEDGEGAAGQGGERADAEEEDDEELDLGDLDDDLDLLRELNSSADGDGDEGGAQGGAAAGAKHRETGELGSYEEVGKSDCNSSSNAELEAQIALELAGISDDDL